MNFEELHRIQIRLEGLRLDSEGYLERWRDMPGGESSPPPRVVAADYGAKQSVYFGSGIDREIEKLIRGLPVRSLLECDGRVFDILERQKKVTGHAEFRTYSISSGCSVQLSPKVQMLSSGDERLRGFDNGFFGNEYDSVFAVFAESTIASAAVSSREDGTAAELWVYTPPQYRRQGLAAQAANAWLRNVVDRGLIPFYSHLKNNKASRRLAESMHLRRCFVLSCYP